jgi:hypothetical protein
VCSNNAVIDSATGFLIWFSNPLDAVTISGTITVNLWMSESNMSANAGAEIAIGRADGAGVWIANVLGCFPARTTAAGTTSEFGTELPVTTRAAQNWTATPASTTLSAGDLLVFAVRANDAGGTMASGFTYNCGYSGGTAAADGDTWIQFTETITEQVVQVVPYRNPMPSLLAQ